MTEARFQAKLLTALRQHPALREAVIWKLSDRFTRGIPDVFVSMDGVTRFFELKVWPNRPTKIQRYWLERLGTERAYVVTLLRNGSVVFDNDLEGGPWSLEDALGRIVAMWMVE